ncbi:MAG TPA: DUF5652 family protein [Candidatus Saccharimonadales bacterium]|nr:DUF5652 family protein [Candidatus Saccharimonadales bacterium]
MTPLFWENVGIYVLFIWSLFWKGVALWRAAQLKQRNWFVVMLVLNSIGILEIIYLFRFAKKRFTFKEMKDWKNYFTTNSTDKK